MYLCLYSVTGAGAWAAYEYRRFIGRGGRLVIVLYPCMCYDVVLCMCTRTFAQALKYKVWSCAVHTFIPVCQPKLRFSPFVFVIIHTSQYITLLCQSRRVESILIRQYEASGRPSTTMCSFFIRCNPRGAGDTRSVPCVWTERRVYSAIY